MADQLALILDVTKRREDGKGNAGRNLSVRWLNLRGDHLGVLNNPRR